MDKEVSKKHPFEDALEVVLNSTPEVLSPIITTAAEEFTFKGWEYAAHEEPASLSPAFRRLLVKVIEEEKDEGEEISGVIVDRVGIITLQSLGGNRSLLRVPRRSDWHFVDAERKILHDTRYQGYAGPQDFNWFADESPFTRFLTHLFTEFQRLAFVDFREKPSLGFKLPHREKDG